MDIKQVLAQHVNSMNYDDLCGGRMCGFYAICALELGDLLSGFVAQGFEVEINGTPGGLAIKLKKGAEECWSFSQYYDTFSEFCGIERTIDFKMYEKAYSKLIALKP